MNTTQHAGLKYEALEYISLLWSLQDLASRTSYIRQFHTFCKTLDIIHTKMDEKAVDIETVHTDNGPHDAKLDIPPVTWWKDPGLRHLYLMMPILFLGSTINGYDGSLLNGLQTMEQWRSYFGYPSGAQLGLFTAIQNVGAVCALPFSSYLADLFGRRIGVEVGIIMVFVGVVVQSVPGVDDGMFIGGRFLVGFGSNLSQGSAPLLIMEASRIDILPCVCTQC